MYHSIDLDGWMSAAIVKYWFNNTYLNNYPNAGLNIITGDIPKIPNDTITFIGYKYGQDIPDVSGYDKVIMCDISFPKEEMEKIFNKLYSNFIWIDHHISAIKNILPNSNRNDIFDGMREIDYSACELTWKYFFPDDEMPKIVRLLGRYDCFKHIGTEEEKEIVQFQYGAQSIISSMEQAHHELVDNMYCDNTELKILNKGKIIYKYLKIKSEQLYKSGFDIELAEPLTFNGGEKNGIKELRKFICINSKPINLIDFDIDCHKDGYDGIACFHYEHGNWNFGLYNNNGKVDCSLIAEQFGGGGHKGSSGFRVDDINEFFNKHKS